MRVETRLMPNRRTSAKLRSALRNSVKGGLHSIPVVGTFIDDAVYGTLAEEEARKKEAELRKRLDEIQRQGTDSQAESQRLLAMMAETQGLLGALVLFIAGKNGPQALPPRFQDALWQWIDTVEEHPDALASETNNEIRLLPYDGAAETDEASPPQDIGRLLGPAPPLPRNHLERAEAHETIKRALLQSVNSTVGITASARQQEDRTVGLYAMGGAGKTVLASVMAYDDDVRRAFYSGVIWAPIGQKPDLTARVCDVVSQLEEEDWHTDSLISAKTKLGQVLSDKRCLLILDDVWDEAHIEPFSVPSHAGRILVTTRRRSLLPENQMTNLDLLTPNESMELLAKTTDETDPADLDDAARSVVDECGGLPLALCICAARKNKGMNWQSLLDALRNIDVATLDLSSGDPRRSVERSIQVGLEFLPANQHGLYLLLGLFPEDARIEEAAIHALWGRVGLKPYQCDCLLTDLVDLSLISAEGASPNRQLSLHDLQRDYALSRAEDAPQPTASAMTDALLAIHTDWPARATARSAMRWLTRRDIGEEAVLTDYIDCLWHGTHGLGREAILVAVSLGPNCTDALQFEGDLLHAFLIAVLHSDNREDWLAQLANLPHERFSGEKGLEILVAACQIDLDLKNDKASNVAAVLRTVERLRRQEREGEQIPERVVQELIMELQNHALYDLTEVWLWLAETADVSHSADRLMDALPGLALYNHRSIVLSVCRNALGLNRPTKSSQRETSRPLQTAIEKFAELVQKQRVGILDGTRNGIGVLLDILDDQLEEAWSQRDERWRGPETITQQRLSDNGAENHTAESEREREHYGIFSSLYFDPHIGSYETWHMLGKALESVLSAVLQAGSSEHFDLAADVSLRDRWDLPTCLCLLTLYDAYHDETTRRGWHRESIMSLLLDQSVCDRASASRWRMLLRDVAGEAFSEAEKRDMLEMIRWANLPETTKALELLRIEDWGILEARDIELIDRANVRRMGKKPTDPRTPEGLAAWHGEVQSIQRRLQIEPHSNEVESLLRQVEPFLLYNESDNEPDRSAPGLLRALEALKDLRTRAELRSPHLLPHWLSWCEKTLRMLRKWACPPGTHPLASSQHRTVLEKYMPYWQDLAGEALAVVEQADPECFPEGETGAMVVPSDNPHANACGYLSLLLATPDGEYCHEMATRFAEAIRDNWPKYPSFVRLVTLIEMSPYHWGRSGALRELARRVLADEPDPYVVLRMLKCFTWTLSLSDRIKTVASLLARIPELGDPPILLEDLGRFVGGLEVNLAVEADSEQKEALEKLTTVLESLPPDTQMATAHQILLGACDMLCRLDAPSEAHLDALISRLDWALDRCLTPSRREVETLERFARVLRDIPEVKWQRHVRETLGERLLPSVLHLLRDGNIREFEWLHLFLPNRLCVAPEISPEYRRYGKRPLRFSDAALLDICKASVERVVAWNKMAQSSEGILAPQWLPAYPRILDGRETANLAIAALQAAEDQLEFARSLYPLIDQLADSGLESQAAAIRRESRSAESTPRT